MNNAQLNELLVQYMRETGTKELDDGDVIEFAAYALAERKRLDSVLRAREICLSGGGHFFAFMVNMPLGSEIVYENDKTTMNGWRACDIKCNNCDAWLTIRYEEKAT